MQGLAVWHFSLPNLQGMVCTHSLSLLSGISADSAKPRSLQSLHRQLHAGWMASTRAATAVQQRPVGTLPLVAQGAGVIVLAVPALHLAGHQEVIIITCMHCQM